MGGLILFGLVLLAVVILLTPAMRTRGRRDRDNVQQTAHEAVISRLEDHRKRRKQGGDESADG